MHFYVVICGQCIINCLQRRKRKEERESRRKAMNLTEYLDVIPEDDVFYSTECKWKFEFDEEIETSINTRISQDDKSEELGIDRETSTKSSENEERSSHDGQEYIGS